MRGRRRHDVVLARSPPWPRVPRQARRARADHRGAPRTGRGFFERRGGATISSGASRPRASDAPFLAGSTGMPFRRFVPYDVIAAGAWSTTFVMLGYVFWHSFDRVVDIAQQGGVRARRRRRVVATVVVCYRQLRDAENRAPPRLDRAQAERPLLRPFALGRWRSGSVCSCPSRTLSGPARFAWNRLTPGNLGLELTTLLAVAAVGSFAFFGYLICCGTAGSHASATSASCAGSRTEMPAGWSKTAKLVRGSAACRSSRRSSR